MEVVNDDIAEFEMAASCSRWIFAKTYTNFAPHEYILRKDFPSFVFSNMVRVIRKHGFKARYGRFKPQIYFICGDHYYWTMGAPVEETTVINRAPLSENELVDGVWRRKLDIP